MKTVSVSELLLWKQCRAQWAFRYRDGLVPKQKATNLILGTAVHVTIEAVLTGTIDRAAIADYAEHALEVEFNGQMDKVGKYAGGVAHSVNQVPPWIWDQEWVVEELLEEVYSGAIIVHGAGGEYDILAPKDLTIRYKPDIYRRQDGVLDILDFKNSDKMPLSYLLGNPQLSWYGALLHHRYPDDFIQFQYVMLPRDKRKHGIDHEPWPMGLKTLVAAEEEMLGWAKEVGELEPVRNRGFWCDNCDFSPLTRMALTGGSTSGIINELYQKKESG